MISTSPKLTTYPCGCVNGLHEPSGALRRVSTCQRHTRAQRAPESLGEAYYAELGLLKHGMLLPTNHVAELTEALGPIPAPKGNSDVLEVGCGVSPYASVLIERRWRYTAIEPSKWACGWMERIYGMDATMIWSPFEEFTSELIKDRFGLILAAHSIEHMDDAPGAIARCAELLAPGGQLWIVIPDDTDKVNPDHRWAFSHDSLWFTVEAAGLSVEALETRRYTARENFNYLRARKPGAVPNEIKAGESREQRQAVGVDRQEAGS